jgi:predicted dehydrogenase
MARLKETGADAEVATIMRHAKGAISTTISSSDNPGANLANILGSEAWIEIGELGNAFYVPTSFRVIGADDRLIEEYHSDVPGRGMQFEAREVERLVAEGRLAGDIMPPEETVSIMATLDEVRRQIGVRYPTE